MKIRTDIAVFIIFLICLFSFLIFSVSSHVKKGGERMAERKIFVDSLFADLSLYGEIVEVNIVENGGRPIRIRCIEIIKSSVDSFYIFNKEFNTAFKIQKNMAVMSGGARDYDTLRFIDINNNFPGMLTLYDYNFEIILQGPMNSSFSAAYLL